MIIELFALSAVCAGILAFFFISLMVIRQDIGELESGERSVEKEERNDNSIYKGYTSSKT